MTTKIISILLGLTILIFGLTYGSPIEITFQPGHRIGVLILAIFIGLNFYFLIRQSLKFKKLGLKIAGLGLISVILLPYLWIGLWTVPQAIFSSEYPMYKDVSTYKNKNGELLVGQFIEISGSLHHSQNRKVLYNFDNGIRISYLFPEKKINGTWEYHRFEFNDGFASKTDTTFIAEFQNGRFKK
ncbi:hypothetical protein [Mariniflexile sp. AS56]|uniref:hypothetical protein n=1 Tax=Mariniflexile sp. AS56 TaxID=3063957 RepID=UPI0026EF9E3E|nr:hypothetical protein [Mariniflexile sp. AS56]MDO7174198.1 hypothetical protein [Mariniflexile sp. AS56]